MNRITHTIASDVLIIGSGLAGLLLALELSATGLKITLASKSELADSNTSRAQGGLAAVTKSDLTDSPELHLQDTIRAGAGLTDERAASAILQDGAELVARLNELGVGFDKEQSGELERAREGGHSRARVLHRKDATGKAISQGLIEALYFCSTTEVLEGAFVVDLIIDEGVCKGAYLLVDGKLVNVSAGQVVLATGGIGQVYGRTTNPLVATGDGIAVAYRAGAKLIDMEFVQFHPTALYRPGAPVFLISEAVRGAGAVLLDRNGQPFAKRFDPAAELATRDVVSRAMTAIMHEQNTACVWLDMRPIGPDMESKFPNILENCRSWGINPVSEPIPVAPAAHYFMGGIATDLHGRTNIPGLFALGECASIGLHGANRLASNSLLEAGVMALRVSRYWADHTVLNMTASVRHTAWLAPKSVPRSVERFKHAMYRFAGLERDKEGLETLLYDVCADQEMALPNSPPAVEAANILLIGQLIAQAALARQESRGAHFRLDFPAIDDHKFAKRLCLSQERTSWLDVPQSVEVTRGRLTQVGSK